MTAFNRPQGLEADVRLLIAGSLWMLTAVAAFVLMIRAVLGHFDVASPAVIPALATALSTIGSLAAFSLLFSARGVRESARNTPALRVIVGVVSLCVPAITAWATTVNASPLAAGIATGFLVLGLAFVVVSEGVHSIAVTEDESIAATPIDESSRTSATTEEEAFLTMPVADFESGAALDADLFQQWSRRQAADGTERIDAVIRAMFAAHERETAIHIPIQPSLNGALSVDCEPLDQTDVRLTVSAVQPYGVRIQVQRTGSVSERLSVPIGVEIRSSAVAEHVA